jgi:hypothetical protein
MSEFRFDPFQFRIFSYYLSQAMIFHQSKKTHNKVVYTAISNGKDNLHPQPSILRDGAEFVAFTDDHTRTAGWDLKRVSTGFGSPNRNAKVHKILPHVYFPDKTYTLWIDGSIVLKKNFSFDKLVDKYLQDSDLAVLQHPIRICLYQEAAECIHLNLDNHDKIRQQIFRYTSDQFEPNLGLAECKIILRRNNEAVESFSEFWWQEICNGSQRDQISFNYAAYKTGLKFCYFDKIDLDFYWERQHNH